MRHMGKMGLSEKFENIESNAEIWENGVCDIWEKWGWRELKKMSNEILGYGGKRGVRNMEKRGLSEKFEKVESNSGIWEKGVCDMWEKWGWREKKSNEMLRYGRKGWATSDKKGLERERKKGAELNSGIWEKGGVRHMGENGLSG